MNSRLFIAFLLFANFLFSQTEKDSTFQDSVKVHSPRKALIYSAIIPGSGQIYNHIAMTKGKGTNKVYWKVPLIYSALAGTTYFLIQNQSQLHSIKSEYNNKLADPTFSTEEWVNYGLDDLEILYKKTLTKRDLSILGVGAVYLIQMIDANIEGHFVSFDISPDLTMNISPKLYSYNSVGVGFNLKIH